MADSTTLPGLRELLHAAVESVGGSERPGQVEMAEAVARSIRTGEHLAVQAGTGTGKSLAYLVPAIRHAVERATTVVVSTATIALQRQLVERDLPRLATALAEQLGREPTFAILKGRSNYVCLQRLDSGSAEEPGDGEALFEPSAVSALAREITRVREWASETATGDRDELIPGVTARAWRQVSVSARECLGASRCPVGVDCFAELAKAEAARADVVVTNHALLAINALEGYQLLPEHDLVVIDEAHDLVGRITSVATAELSQNGMTVAARRCAKLVDEAVVDRMSEAAEGIGIILASQEPGRIDAPSEALSGALRASRDAAAGCLTALGTQRREDAEAASAHRLARTVVEEVHDTAVRMLDCCEEPVAERREVVWASGDADRPAMLHIAPLGVAGLLRERLFHQTTTVLTSATLALGGSFDTLARQWGLPEEGATAGIPRRPTDATASGTAPAPDEAPLAWRSLDVGSPFQHASSGILYVASHLPPPGREGLPSAYTDELAELVGAAGGRTLGLFSSMRAAKHATEVLRERLETPILCQGDDATGLLVRQFAADPATSLFGTLSLWQGVDVPGPSLQLVVVDRIPFPRPDDPLASARQRAVQAHGGNGFLRVAASHAALLLAQGTGRLLRSMSDRGVVAILDPRLATARYGGFLRASLPAFWPTEDGKVARAALRRLDASAREDEGSAGDQSAAQRTDHG